MTSDNTPTLIPDLGDLTLTQLANTPTTVRAAIHAYTAADDHHNQTPGVTHTSCSNLTTFEKTLNHTSDPP